MMFANDGRYDAGMREISFRELFFFIESGRSDTDAETSCAEFIFDVIGLPLVEIFREEVTPSSIAKGLNAIRTMTKTATELFKSVPALSMLLAFLDSVQILFDSAAKDPNEQLPHAPSTLRSALATVHDCLKDEACPLSLALRFGPTGLHLAKDAEAHITTDANDSAATTAFEAAVEKLAVICEAQGHAHSEGVAPDDLSSLLGSVVAALEQWGDNSREENNEVVDKFFADFGAALYDETQNAANTFSDEDLEALEEAISFVFGVKGLMAGADDDSDRGAVGPSEAAHEVDGTAPLDQSAEVFAKVFDEITNNMEARIKQYLGVADSAVCAQEKALRMMTTTLPNFQFSKPMAAIRTIANNKVAALHLIADVMASSEFFTAPQKKLYPEMLQEWEEWGKADKDNEAKPALELLIVGAEVVRELGLMYKQSSSEDPNDEWTGTDTIATMLSKGVVRSRYDATLQGFVSDAMQSVHNATVMFKTGLLDNESVKRYSSEKRFVQCSHMMIGASSTEMVDPKSAIYTVVKEVDAALATHTNGIPSEFDWSHSVAVNMAQKTLALLEARDPW